MFFEKQNAGSEHRSSGFEWSGTVRRAGPGSGLAFGPLAPPTRERVGSPRPWQGAELLACFRSGTVPAPDGQIEGLLSTNRSRKLL